MRCMDNSPSSLPRVCFANVHYGDGGSLWEPTAAARPSPVLEHTQPGPSRWSQHIHPQLPSHGLLAGDRGPWLPTLSSTTLHLRFFSKCQQVILYPGKVILLPHSLKVKEKEFYTRKRFKLEKKKRARTGKGGGSCRRERVHPADPPPPLPQRGLQFLEPRPRHQSPAADAWEARLSCECFILNSFL